MSRILMVSSEAAPYAKTGGLADVVGALPHALQQIGHEVAVLIPRYRSTFPYATRRVTDPFQVQLGPYPTRKEAEAMRDKLAADGFMAMVK